MTLSRRPDWKIGTEKDNNNQKLMKEEWVKGIIEVIVEELETILVEKIKRVKGKDEEVVKVEEMKKVGVKVLRGDKQKIEGNLVLKEEKVYVLKNKKLRLEVIQLYHDVLVAKHEGILKMTELVTRNYQWLGVTKDIEKYMKECDLCQKMKNKTEVLVRKLMYQRRHKHT